MHFSTFLNLLERDFSEKISLGISNSAVLVSKRAYFFQMEERISIRAEKARRSPIPRGSYFRSVCTIFSLTNTDVDVRHIRTSADDRRLNSSMVQREEEEFGMQKLSSIYSLN